MILIPLAFVSAAILAGLLNALELIPWRRAAGTHWTERARLLYPVRVSRAKNLMVIPAGLTLWIRLADPAIPWGWVAAAAFLGTLLGNYPMDRETNPGIRFGDWAHQVTCSWLLKLYAWGNYVLAACLMPVHYGWATWAVTMGSIAVFLTLQFGGGVRLMRALRLLKPASTRLEALVATTSAAMGVPVRATWEMVGSEANALALVATRELAFTSKLLAVASDDDLKAICAHELGHLSEGRWTLAGRLTGALVLFPIIFVRPAYGLAQEAGLAFLGFIILFIWLGNLKLSQAMEKRADKVARESVEETAAYARALELFYRVNQAPAVIKKGTGQIHPDLYDRMEAAGLKPDYPRPAAPSSQSWSSYFMSIVTVIAGLALIWK